MKSIINDLDTNFLVISICRRTVGVLKTLARVEWSS